MLRLRRKHEVSFASGVLMRTHEQVFLERYDWLLDWAERFTGSREDAGDVVHDAFVQFTLKQPKLVDIANLDAYLCTMIRNLHVSLVRRRNSRSIRPLTLVEYDSFQAGVRAIDLTLGIHAEEQLRLICRYACERKATAKAASILILRFFHGFYTGEVALILRCSRQAVEVRLSQARREAKDCCARPKCAQAGIATDVQTSSADLTAALRKIIFDARVGDCMARDRLRALYAAHEHEVLDCADLAHIVSCPACLDEITETLGLTPLGRRRLTDFADRPVHAPVTEKDR